MASNTTDRAIDGTDGDDIINEAYVDADGESLLNTLNSYDGPIDVIYAGLGNDTITLYTPSLDFSSGEVHAGGGDDTIEIRGGGGTYYGEAGNDTISVIDSGSRFGTALLGGSGDDVLDLFVYLSETGGFLAGGDGSDTFKVYGSNSNYGVSIRVHDYDPRVDTLIVNGDTIDADNFIGGFHIDGAVEIRDTASGIAIESYEIAEDRDYVGTTIYIRGWTIADLEASFSDTVTTATRGSHFATAMIGAPREDENGLKEATAVHLGNGVYLTDSRFRIEADGTGLDADLTFVHGQGTDIEQDAFTLANTIADRNAIDLDRAGADEIAIVNTGVDAGHRIGMVIYADPSEAEGQFHINSYSRSEQGEVMHEYDVTLSEGAYRDVTLRNRDVANDVWVTDGLPIEPENLGGTQGAGLFQEVNGVDYLAGIMVGPWVPRTDQAFVVDPVGENYARMARIMLETGSADDYGTNLLVASSDGGRLRGTGLNEILQGGDARDVLVGGGGDDRLVDGAGSDRLRGGDGADIFVLVNDGENDRIVDFDISSDRIDLTDYDIASLDDVSMRTVRDGVVRLTVGDDTVTIRDGDGVRDLTAADLTDDVFII